MAQKEAEALQVQVETYLDTLGFQLREDSPTIQQLTDKIHHWMVVRPVIVDNNNPYTILQYLQAELYEFFEAVIMRATGEIDDDMEIVGEIGDLVHLFSDFVKLEQTDLTHAITHNGIRDRNTTIDFLKQQPQTKDLQFKAAELLEHIPDIFNYIQEQALTLAAVMEEVIVDLMEDLEKQDRARMERDMAQFAALLLQLGHVMEIDLVFAVILKNMRNDLKYPAEYYQDGEYEAASRKSKKIWAHTGGDGQFFQTFQQVAAAQVH